MAKNNVLFTLEGREDILRRMKEVRPRTHLIPKEEGFLDHPEGLPVSDGGALDMLLEASVKIKLGRESVPL